jgi:hypothetical protein
MSKQNERGLKGFFMSLLPNFEKKRLVEAASGAFKELRITNEMYGIDTRAMADLMKTDFKSLDTVLRQRVKDYRGDVVALVRTLTDARIKEEGEFLDHIEKIYGPVVLQDALDYQKLYMLRYLDGLFFFNTYARKLILVMTNRLITDPDMVSAVDRMDVEYVMDRDNMTMFAIMLDTLAVKVADFRNVIGKLKNVQFKPETHDTLARGNRELDPYQSNLMPVVGGLVFALGRTYNLYLAKRLEEAKEQKDKLQVTLLLLRRKLDSTDDPAEQEKLCRQLDYYNNLLNKIAAKIEDIEEGH